MKTFFKNLKSGLTIGLGILVMLFIGGVVFASLSNVEEGDILSAQKWNELVGNVNDINLALDGGLASPTGAVIAFNRNTCPSGWLPANGSNGTPDLRGRFIRGLGGSENGEDTARALRSYQIDQLRPIIGNINTNNTNGIIVWNNNSITHSGALYHKNVASYTPTTTIYSNKGIDIGFDSTLLGENYDGSDTHPKNIALIYCVKE